jgi:hypothetical protein
MMRTPGRLIALLLLSACSSSPVASQDPADGLSFTVSAADSSQIPSLRAMAITGRGVVKAFFGGTVIPSFAITVYGTRAAWDSLWRARNIEPACWIIGGAGAGGLDLFSPRLWASESCGHGGGAVEVQQVVTHEEVHVHHDQQLARANVRLDGTMVWFREGLAVLVSGQLTAADRQALRSALAGGAMVARLEDLWTGSLAYPMSGSMAEYLDRHYGRAGILALLEVPSKSGLLARLGVSEVELLAAWRSELLSQ